MMMSPVYVSWLAKHSLRTSLAVLWLSIQLIGPMAAWAQEALPESIAAPAAWSLAPGKTNTFALHEEGSRASVVASGRQLIILSKETLGPGQKLVARFRVIGDGPASLTLSAGHEDAANMRDKGGYVSISVRNGNIAWNMLDPNANFRLPIARGNYKPVFDVNRSLGWPEVLRRNVEADMVTSKKRSDRWMSLELVLRDHGLESTLDGIPLAKSAHADINTQGHARLMMSTNVQLASLNISSADAMGSDWVHRSIALESILNASTIDGKRVDLSSLGKEGQLEVEGIPFQLAQVDAGENDHVDLGSSWFRQGNLDGRYSGRGTDAMAARWAGALIHDPARLTVRLPMAGYTALHLLAAADGEDNSVPVVTAQFYRAQSGMPKNFAARVPIFTTKASNVKSVAVKTTPAGQGRLYLVTIPIDPAQLQEFADLDYVELELTKEVQLYRASPDPLYYSFHAAGLPSSVHVYALTAQRPAVDVAFKPDAYGDIWTVPEKPAYTVTFANRKGKARSIDVQMTTNSLDGKHTTKQSHNVKLQADKNTELMLPLSLEAHGHHDVKLTITDGKESFSLERSLAYLHEDTRERGNWDFGKGPLFGFYNWGGGHHTPSAEKQLLVMAKAGIEVVQGTYEEYIRRHGEEARKVMEEYKLFTLKLAGAGDHYITARFANDLKNLGLEAAKEKFLADIEKAKSAAGPNSRPLFLSWFPEPSIGPVTHGIFPQFLGEPAQVFTPAEQVRYELFRDGFIQGTKIVRKHYPEVKNLMPHGDPTFVIHFLQNDPKLIAPLLDGVTVDIPCFERLPEQQFHQVSLHRLYMARKSMADAGIDKPFLPMYEGPCVPSGPGALTNQEQADITIRNSLILQVYGVDIQNGGFPAFDTASYWGEQHYGFGVLNRVALETPKPAYAALATMTRHLNRSNYDGYLPTGSHSLYALRFKHYKTSKPVYSLWTLRGKRTVTLTTSDAKNIKVYDQMDNLIELDRQGDKVTFTVDQSPCYVQGLASDPQVSAGQVDHSDAAPAKHNQKIASLGDGSWSLTMQKEEGYEGSHTPYIYRYPSPMTAKTVSEADGPVSQALAVNFPDPETDRVYVPYYSVLKPKAPIQIQGKASHLGLWAKGNSDWGRAVYFLRDAKGEQWINVGTRGAWNCDDLHSWMSFNFDGWRYLRMEMPANSGYDNYRESGSTWWGPYSAGDGVIDLPLSLEKIVVERRTHVMYVDSPQPANRADVLLGDLHVEYAQPSDATDEAVRVSQVRMPVPQNVEGLDNPIARMRQENAGKPIQITGITLPQHGADGTRCFVEFPTVEGAATYDVWASAEADGTGALNLGKNWKEPGRQIAGLRANQDFFLFVTWTDAEGNVSKPSPAYKINLEDFFGMK